MKKIIVALVIAGSLMYFISCSKSSNPGYSSCTGTPVAGDSSALLAFAKADSITVTKDTSGLYYQIVNQGTGASPSGTSRITFTYMARFMNGAIFDSTSSPTTYGLDSLILGWQYGLPKIQAGGHIKLLLPSALAYGCAGSGRVPPNAPVYYDVNLISVQ